LEHHGLFVFCGSGDAKPCMPHIHKQIDTWRSRGRKWKQERLADRQSKRARRWALNKDNASHHTHAPNSNEPDEEEIDLLMEDPDPFEEEDPFGLGVL